MRIACCGTLWEKTSYNCYVHIWNERPQRNERENKCPCDMARAANLNAAAHYMQNRFQAFLEGNAALFVLHHLVKILTADMIVTSTTAINHISPLADPFTHPPLHSPRARSHL